MHGDTKLVINNLTKSYISHDIYKTPYFFVSILFMN